MDYKLSISNLDSQTDQGKDPPGTVCATGLRPTYCKSWQAWISLSHGILIFLHGRDRNKTRGILEKLFKSFINPTPKNLRAFSIGVQIC